MSQASPLLLLLLLLRHLKKKKPENSKATGFYAMFERCFAFSILLIPTSLNERTKKLHNNQMKKLGLCCGFNFGCCCCYIFFSSYCLCMTCRDIDLVFLKLDSWIMNPKNFIEWRNLILTCIVQSIFRLSTTVVVAVFVVIVVWLWSLLSCTVMKCYKRMKKKKNYAKMISTW